MKSLNEIRNELTAYAVEHSKKDSATVEHYLKYGFDAAIAEMKKRNQVLVDAVHLIAEEMVDHSEYIAGLALQQYKESVGE